MTQWAEHGGRLEQARHGFGGESWIDLSTGINPHGWPGVDTVTIDWRALPDPGMLRTLEIEAARHFDADPDCVIALPGTEIGLRLLGDLLPRPLRHRWPSYRTHAEMAAGSIAIPPEGMADAAAGTLVLANPNNPDGQHIAAEALLALLARMQAGNGCLVVDEAFADANPQHSLTSHVGGDLPLVVLRSFGKFFGLAGVRLGFLLGPASLVAKLRARLGAWPVSAAGIAIGTAAYRDTGWIAATRERLPRDAAALDQVLERHGLRPTGACPLFRLIETPDAHALFERLARRSILTRPFDYDRSWLRVGLPPDADALARLNRALANG